MAGRTELVDCAESSHAVALLLLIDNTNNSGASVRGWSGRLSWTRSGPPETAVVGSCSRGWRGLLRAPSWRGLLGRSAQTLVVVRAWSGFTEGSERGRLLVRWLVVRWRWVGDLRCALSTAAGSGSFGVPCGSPNDPTSRPTGLGRLTPHMQGLGDPDLCVRGVGRFGLRYGARNDPDHPVRVGLNVTWTSKTPRTSAARDAGRFEHDNCAPGDPDHRDAGAGRLVVNYSPRSDPDPPERPHRGATGPDPATKWRSRNDRELLRRSSDTGGRAAALVRGASAWGGR